MTAATIRVTASVVNDWSVAVFGITAPLETIHCGLTIRNASGPPNIALVW